MQLLMPWWTGRKVLIRKALLARGLGLAFLSLYKLSLCLHLHPHASTLQPFTLETSHQWRISNFFPSTYFLFLLFWDGFAYLFCPPLHFKTLTLDPPNLTLNSNHNPQVLLLSSFFSVLSTSTVFFVVPKYFYCLPTNQMVPILQTLNPVSPFPEHHTRKTKIRKIFHI